MFFYNRLYISIDILKLVFTSFCVTILALYMLKIRGKIIISIPFEKILFDNDYQSKSFVKYDDLFVSLENDIQTLQETPEEEDIHEEHQHSEHDTSEEHTDDADDNHNYMPLKEKVITTSDKHKHNSSVNTQRIMVDEDILNNNKHIIVSLNDFTNTEIEHHDLPNNTETIPDTVKENKQNLDMNVSNTIPWERTISENNNQYILPIADALEKDNGVLANNRYHVKSNFGASLYKKRKETTLNVRALVSNITKDITRLKALFRTFGMPVSDKFLNLQTNIKEAKILKTLKITRSELHTKYPVLNAKLQELYRLRVFTSFLPINEPVINVRRSSPFGFRSDPFNKRRRMHSGLDFAARTGTPIMASGIGVVKFSGVKSGYGNVIDIYHGSGIVTRYAHLSRIFVKKGQRVTGGFKIGAAGSTGRSTGAHLHYEIRINNRAVNPDIFLSKRNYVKNIFSNY